MTDSTIPAPAPRITYLDSVRGLAALSVVVYHFIGWRWADTLQFKLAAMVFNGSDAVSLFFVLSGLVLSWKYFQPDESLVIDGAHYREFIINRLVRLYLPYVTAVLLIYYYMAHRHGDNAQMISEFVHNTFNWFEEVLLVRGRHDLYNPGWTLEIEMAASLMLPFLVLLLRYNRQLFVMLALVNLVLGPPLVLHFLWHFMLGMLLAYNFVQISRYDLRTHRFYRWRYLLYLVAFLLFSVRHILRIFPLNESGNYWMGLFRLDLFQFTGLGAFIILAYIINSPHLQRWLNTAPLLFLGRISYSVYLVHWFFVQWVMDKWDRYTAFFDRPKLAFLVLLAGTVVATLITATIFNILVERPAIRLGKRLSARFLPAQPAALPIA